MKKLIILAVVLLSYNAQAQKGIELRVGGGIGFLGKDPWFETGLLSATVLYNFNGVVAIGPSYTTGIATTFRIDSDGNKYDATLSEIGVLGQFTLLRAGKFKMYGTGNISIVSGKTDPMPDFRLSPPGGNVVIEDTSVGLGFGVGLLLNLSSGLYFNILDLYIRPVGSEFMDMDKGFEGSIGPFYMIRTGITYSFQSN